MINHIERPLMYLLVVLSIAISSCDPNKIYDKYQDFDNAVWHVDSLATYTFVVDDVSLPYNLVYNIRYGIAYPFRNLYFTYYLEDSLGNTIASDLQEVNLFESKTGQPLGSGMGDIIDLNVAGMSNYTFTKPGQYKFMVKQFMRQDELPYIFSFGLTVSKVSSNE